MTPRTDYTGLSYVGPINPLEVKAREEAFVLLLEQLRRSVIREYKRIICFDPDVLAKDQELRSVCCASVRVPEASINRWASTVVR
jgi:hypothetical protein